MAKNQHVSRRRFLGGIGAGTLGLAGASLANPALAADEGSRGKTDGTAASGEVTQLSEHLAVYHGPINVGIIRDGTEALLIDCGDGSVARRLLDMGIATVQRVIFTHHHRDQACGVYSLVNQGAKIGVPAGEREHFDAVQFFWNDPKTRWHVYKLHPHHLMLTESVPVDAAYSPGDTFTFGAAAIRVIPTPGHTDGSVSYLVEVDGRRVIFSGDAIYDEGRIWEIHSLQKGFRRGNRQIRDYHGFLGAQDELIESLGRIKEAEPRRVGPRPTSFGSLGHVETAGKAAQLWAGLPTRPRAGGTVGRPPHNRGRPGRPSRHRPDDLASAVYLAERRPSGPRHQKRRFMAMARIQNDGLSLPRPNLLPRGPLG